MPDMTGRVAVITGGANGIGQAAARLFARAGAAVVIADIEHEAAEQTAREIRDEGFAAAGLYCDVGKADSVQALADAVLARFGRVDVLFANAAIQLTKTAAETTQEEWDHLHATNLRGVFLCCKAVIPAMQVQRSGSIVISSSGHAFATYPRCSAYAASKGGQVALMRGLALDYAADGIRVNCVIPGATDTRLIRNYLAASQDPHRERERLLASIPLRRLAKPEEIAEAVLFLASGRAAYITGTTLTVDGGLLAQA
jgi:NAD(P)-dependent dehydrogenase (short-subunit alcohol dehydrogenase family)